MKLFIFLTLTAYVAVTMSFWLCFVDFTLKEAMQCAAPVVMFVWLIVSFITSFEGARTKSPLDDLTELQDND